MAAELDCSGLKTCQDVFQVNFSNGKLKENSKKNVKFELKKSQSQEKGKKEQKTLIAETKRMKYIGENFGTYSCQAQIMSKYYIGILNKSTGKMRIVEAPIMKLRPQIHQEEDNVPEIPTNLNLSFREKADRLTSMFGSSKKKRAMEARLRNQIKGEALEMALGEAVDHVMSQPNATKVISPVKTASTSSLIPPYNKDAATPTDVYPLKHIVSEEEIAALSTSAQVFVDSTREQIQKWRTEGSYSGYVLDHVTVLPMRAEARRRKATILLYLQYLIKLYQLKANELRSKEPLPSTVPDFVKKQLFEKFTLEAGGEGRKVTRCMPARLKDKLISYILVLCLIIDEFQVVLGPIQIDLKIGQQRLMMFTRALGCRYTINKTSEFGQKTSTQTARLEVPLTFPDLTERSKKKRR